MFRELMRIKQKLSDAECIEILKAEPRGVLSVLGDDGYPYGMPMNHWYCEENGRIYFHSGPKGHKVDAMREYEKVSFCVYDQGYRREGEWALNIKSVIVFGRIRVVEDQQEAMEFLSWFVQGGKKEMDPAGPKLIDWEFDADLIVADVNKASGQEVRAFPYLHWWTFLSWFQAIGEGLLSTVVSIRSKLARGQKLEGWEKDFYREHKHRVDLPKQYSQQELQQRQQLEQMLNS